MYINKLCEKNKTFCVILLIVASIFHTSCNDFLDVESKHGASEGQHWQTREDARGALMGLYGLLRAAVAENNTHWICGELPMGDFSVYNRADLQSVVYNEFDKSYKLLMDISDYRRFYAVINAASLFIEKASRVYENDKSYSEENLRQDIAQARVIRAFTYFYTVRIWGEKLPFLTYSYDNGAFPVIPIAEPGIILAYAREELLKAITHLPYQFGTDNSKYYGESPSVWRGVLFNQLSAYAILAHVSAWQGNYIDTDAYASMVIDNASKIDAIYHTVDVITSPEGLFSMRKTDGGYAGSKIVSLAFKHTSGETLEGTQSGHLEQLTLANPLVQKPYPDIYVKKEMLSSLFEEITDHRFGYDPETFAYTKKYVYNVEAEYPIFSKIKVIQNGAPKDNDYAVFGSAIIFTRLEELTLLRAEALVVMNRGEEAMGLMNLIRQNRGLPQKSYRLDYSKDPSPDGALVGDEKLLYDIFQERRRELMGEGWRWYDLIRYHRISGYVPEIQKLIDEDKLYWPIRN